MSQQLNEMLNSDTLKGTADQKTTFMFQPTEIRPSSREDMFLGTQVTPTDDEIKSRDSNDGKTSVSVKLEVCEGDRDEGSSNSRAMENLMKESVVAYQDSIKSALEDDFSRDIECSKDSPEEQDPLSCDEGIEETSIVEIRKTGSSVDRKSLEQVENEVVISVGRGVIGERRKGRPRGRKSVSSAHSSFENRNDGTDGSSGIHFGSIEIGTPKFNDSVRGIFVERRKRGRPRGSRGSRGGNSSVEIRSLNESSGSVTDFVIEEIRGDLGTSGSGVLPYETPPSVIKVGRGALRPGCKSYRGRAASMGRGYKMEYHSETPKWEVGTGLIPVEYDSALSPLTDVETLGKRQRSSETLTPPLPKRARGTRGRARGRSRGRPRTSLTLDRSIDSDSSDFGNSRYETPDYGTTGFESPDVSDMRSESEVDVPDSERSTYKRRRGRGSRGGRSLGECDAEDISESMHEEKVVTCSSCKETMSQSLFSYHKLRKHNNCAWRDGIDTPLDLSDAKVVNTLLKQALQKRKQLTCEQCGLSRSSLVGYQSHVTFCAKTEGERDALMETCPICHRRMMPSSLKVHMGIHRQEEKAKKLEKIDSNPEVEIDPGEGSSKSSGKSKRAAANRAVSLMQQFIKGEDILVEKAGHRQVSSTRTVSDFYEGTPKAKEENASEENGKKEISVSLYQIGAWTRAIQRCGRASCKNPGCTFKSSDKNLLTEHFKTCELRPIINFLCKMCSFGCELEEQMRDHVLSVHMEDSSEANSDVEEVPVESAEESEEFEDEELDEEEVEDIEGNSNEEKTKKIKKEPKETSTPAGKHKPPKYSKNVQFLKRQSVSRVFGLHAYITALHWTLDFQLTNHSHVPLYTDWRTRAVDWIYLDEKEAEPYLPRARVSPQFSRVDVGTEMYQPPPGGPTARNVLPWHQLVLFESMVEPARNQFGKNFQPGFITLFAGGPVWAQAWCPTSLFVNCHGAESRIPKKKCTPVSQFMAISCNQDFDTYHSVGEHPKKEKNLIQIWDFGPLTNAEDAVNAPPSMVLGIAHEYGAVWSLEWCPSGCYDEVVEWESSKGNLKDTDAPQNTESVSAPKKEDRLLRRLGLLAAACSDGTVRIFSVPFPSELAVKESVFDLHIDNFNNHNSIVHTDNNVCKVIETEGEQYASESDVNRLIQVIKKEISPSDPKTDSEMFDLNSPNDTKGSREGNNISAFETPTSSRSKSYRTPTNQTYISNLRINSDSPHDKKNVFPVYKPSFVITLVLDDLKDSLGRGNSWQCLRLSWSLLGKSHRILAASFSNGLVALWDLGTTSSLLRVNQTTINGDSLFLRPYHVFLAHTNAVTGLALVTCGAEKREDTGDTYPHYVITGARDRVLKMWDLQDTTAPLTTFPRGLITSVVWLTNWISCVVSNDDGFTHGRSNSKIQAIRQYGYKPTPLLSQNSAVMSVAQSDWLNAVAHGTCAGEACVLVAQQLLLTIESLKTLKTRRTMAFYTELVDFVKEKSEPKSSSSKKIVNVNSEAENMNWDDSAIVEEDGSMQSSKDNDESITLNAEEAEKTDSTFEALPRTYAESSKRFAILFCDLAVDRETGKLPKEAAIKLQQSERMKDVPLDLYPLAAINKMCWNPNLQSFIWLASGHQSGLVRVCRMQKTRNKLVENFENRSAEKVTQMFMKRTECDSSATNPTENLQEGGNKSS